MSSKFSSARKDLKDYILFMLNYSRPYKLALYGLVVLILVFIISGRLIPLIFGWAVDYGIEDKNINYIYYCGFALLISNALRAILSFLISFQFRYIGQKILFEVRRDLLDHVQKIKISYFDKNSSGRIVTRIAHDSKSLGDLFSDGLSGAFINVIEIFSILGALFYISWPMALTVVLILPPVLWAAGILSEKIREQFIYIKSKLSQINAFSAENLNGIQIIQLYGGEDLITKNFNQSVDEYKDLQLKSVTYFALLWPVVEFFQVFSILISLCVGLYLFNLKAITIGEIGAFILMLQGFFRPLRFILEKYNQIQNGITSSQRIIRLFDEETEDGTVETTDTINKATRLDVVRTDSKNKNNQNLKLDSESAIEVRNLSFSYDKKVDVLKSVSFKIKHGSKNAIVGRTGSGKTTLVSLLQGFYSTENQSIFIEGQPIESFYVSELRKKLLVVRQEEFIFKGTVRSNIAIGNKDALHTGLDDQLKDVLKLVGLNLNLDDEIDEMGANLSAGEKQLIALARVMIYDPEIVILDEATSNIDSVSEQKVLMAFDKVLVGRTSIVIAHRLTTVLKSDQILVLEQGKLIESGRTLDLISNKESVFNGFYNELL